MKKIRFTLLALICAITMNAQGQTQQNPYQISLGVNDSIITPPPVTDSVMYIT